MLETFSYIFYFPSSLIGPSFEYSDFLRFINLEREYKNINWNACNISTLSNLFWVGVFTYLVVAFSKITDPMYCTTQDYAAQSVFYKLGYVYLSLVVTRARYYIGWKLGQASIDFCGLGYTLKENADGKSEIHFDKIDQCNLTTMEWSINVKVRLQYWNRSVHLWLKNYIYLRIYQATRSQVLSSLATFSVSALWHGFYPSYYLFFFQYFFIEQITVYLEEDLDLFNKVEKCGAIVRFIFLQMVVMVLKYFGQTFTILSIEGVFKYYQAFNFIPNILLFVVFFIIIFFLKKKKAKQSVSKTT